MNKNILKLTEKVTNAKETYSKAVASAKEKLQAELNEVFDNDSELQTAIVDVEGSTDFGSDESGIYVWTRYNIPDKYKGYEEYLEAYVQDNGFSIDLQYDAIFLYQGECIVINDEGDICLTDGGYHKWIIKNEDYETVEERNELIEEWMESEGFFPAVLKEGYYGDLTLVNTQTKVKEA